MLSKSITFFAVLFSASLCLGEGFLNAGYNSETDEIWIQSKNNCMELDVIYTEECTKSVPGPALILSQTAQASDIKVVSGRCKLEGHNVPSGAAAR